jgi:hypothetical protein
MSNGQVPVVAIKHPTQGHCIINESDFDASVHERVPMPAAPAPEAAPPASTTDAKVTDETTGTDETTTVDDVTTLKIDDALALVAAVQTVDAVDAIEKSEAAHKKAKGGRKKVMEAIAARRAELAPVTGSAAE